MKNSSILTLLTLLTSTLAAPTSSPVSRRQNACFVIGNTALPAEVSDTVTAIQSAITCDTSATTIAGVPDVSSGGISFSSINFATSSQTPLTFALSEFATATPLASTDLKLFENRLNTYLATEAGIRSTGGSLAIKVPKFFLSFQIARIKTAQGIAIESAGQQVDHLLGKVVKNAAGESQALRDQVTALASQLT